MSQRPSSHDPSEPLDPRQQAVLQVVVREHSLTGEPVSSGTVTKIVKLQVSSATIRNVMAELEHRGLLCQPHTSAGRVPTDAGYRAFVNHLVRQPQSVPAQAHEINCALARNRSAIPGLLGEASRQLSSISHQVGLVLAPALGQVVVDRFEFVSLQPRRVLAVLVGRSGVPLNRTLLIDEPLSQSELEHIGRYLSEHFGGHTVPSILEQLEQRLREDSAAFDELQSKSLELCRQAVNEVDDAEVFVEGASNLLESPEFSDLNVVRTLFKTLEEKRKLIRLLHRLLDGDGVQVVIGEENPLAGLERCSIVASTYESNGRALGTVGIVGPTRMQYSRVIPLVDYLARALTDYLSVPDN